MHIAHLWTRQGPTREAGQLLEADGGSLSTGERIVLLAAYAFWTGRGDVRLSEILETLDAGPTEAVALLPAAVKHAPQAVDEWLTDFGFDKPWHPVH